MTRDLPKVLFVDDEPSILRAFALTLRKDPIQVTTVSHPVEALAQIAAHDFAVVASDYRMPRMDGLTFLATCQAMAPFTRRILISGCCDLDIARQAVNSVGIDRIVLKPFGAEELREAVLSSVERYMIDREREEAFHRLGKRASLLEQQARELHRELLTRTETLIESLVSALDLRDTETRWHSRRVAAYARHLGEVLGITGEDLDHVEHGALLHDVGKIGVRDAVLRKPGPLTPDEAEEMRQHALFGFRLLQDIECLRPASTIVLQHHERWDGGGYPAGLKGEDIVIGARIFHVVDTLDAITSHRTYRAARGYDAARAEILRCSGTQFDPKVVEAYASVPDEEWARIAAPLGQHETVAVAPVNMALAV